MSQPRRRFLAGLLMGAGSLALAACGGGGGGASTTTSTTTQSTASTGTSGNTSSTSATASTSSTATPTTSSTATTSVTTSSTGTTSSGSSGTGSTSSSTTATALFYGMNGHPFQGGAYSSQTPAQQIAALADLGVTVYRLDLYGTTAEADTVLAYALAGVASGVTILPCFAMNQPMFTTSEQDNYNWAFQCGVNIATVLSAYCPIYEIGNEIDQYCATGVGETASSYNNTSFQLVRGLLRGAAAGILSVQPNAKIIRGGCITTDIGFNNMLWNGTQPDGTSGHPVLKWDYTGWHWYETSGDIVTAYDGTSTSLNVLQNLQQYGVPVWLTEVGFNAADSDQGAAYIQSVLTEYLAGRTTYNIAGVCFYELYDLVAEGADYGLIASDGVTKKLGYTAFKNFTTAHPV